MAYYPEGRRYLPEVPDRAADYPEPPKIRVNKYFDARKAERLTVSTIKKSRIPAAWRNHEQTEKLREEFYNGLKK